MKARRQWKTQAACHTAQDITWMHVADKTWTACNHKTHVDRRACGRAKSRLHTHTTRQNTERKWPNPDTKPKLKTWVPGSEHHAPIRNKARRRERAHGSSTLKAARSCENRTWRECQGSVTKPMNDTRPKWQTPDTKMRRFTLSFTKLFTHKKQNNSNLILT